jgi:hypothetical protein
MRRLHLEPRGGLLPTAALLLLAGLAPADDPFRDRLQAFEEARKFTLEPGGQARVNPALEALIATGDVRAVGPLASCILDTIVSERRMIEEGRTVEREFSDLADRVVALDSDLKRLELKEKAGDRSVGPAIEKRHAERAQCKHRSDEILAKFAQMERTLAFLRDLRGRVVDGCTSLLKGRKGEEARKGVEGVRRALDPADREQGLLLVGILGASGVETAEEQLLEICTAPKAHEAVRLRAQLALANHLTRRGAEALLRLWEKRRTASPRATSSRSPPRSGSRRSRTRAPGSRPCPEAARGSRRSAFSRGGVLGGRSPGTPRGMELEKGKRE